MCLNKVISLSLSFHYILFSRTQYVSIVPTHLILFPNLHSCRLAIKRVCAGSWGALTISIATVTVIAITLAIVTCCMVSTYGCRRSFNLTKSTFHFFAIRINQSTAVLKYR